MPEIRAKSYNADPLTDWVIARGFKELLEAIQHTGAGGSPADRMGYERLCHMTTGPQMNPITIGFQLKFWMDKWAENSLTTKDLADMAFVTRLLRGSNE